MLTVPQWLAAGASAVSLIGGLAYGGSALDERWVHAAAYSADVRKQTVEIQINRLSAEISSLEVQRTILLGQPRSAPRDAALADIAQQLLIKRAEIEKLKSSRSDNQGG